LGLHGIDQDRVNRAATEIHEFILQNLVRSGRLIKSMHPVHSDQEASPLILPGVDASLLGLCTPYMVFQPEDPIFKSTLAAIEQTIHWPEGGVYRYLGDTYYGGGEWVLLAAWMGWHYARAGKLDNAQALREWVESQADGNGILPEQVNEHPLAPQYYEPWLTKWGPVASPLLWSHAMYILLVNATQQEQERDSSK
jgi:GH15 family glucan-1,4-alpha-glucosidase